MEAFYPPKEKKNRKNIEKCTCVLSHHCRNISIALFIAVLWVSGVALDTLKCQLAISSAGAFMKVVVTVPFHL